jgi:hypothetical protein
VKPVAALVVPGRVLLLRMSGDQRRVHVERQALGCAIKLPEPCPGAGMRYADRVQHAWCGRDPVDDPERRRVRRHLPEQRILLTDRTQIRDALAAVDQHHRQVPDHPARVMTTTPLLDPRKPPRQRAREPHHLSDVRDQRRAGVRHQTPSVRRHFYGYRASIAHHLQGEPPSQGSRTVSKPIFPAQPDVSAPPLTPGARSLLHAPG